MFCFTAVLYITTSDSRQHSSSIVFAVELSLNEPLQLAKQTIVGKKQSCESCSFSDLMFLPLQLISGPLSCLHLTNLYKCSHVFFATEDLLQKLRWLTFRKPDHVQFSKYYSLLIRTAISPTVPNVHLSVELTECRSVRLSLGKRHVHGDMTVTLPKQTTTRLIKKSWCFGSQQRNCA